MRMGGKTAAKVGQSGLDKKTLLNFLHQMLLIRKFEDKGGELYARGKIAGFLHLYNGEEAVAVGAISALEPHDLVITHYRDHGHALARGMDPRRCMAELFGKATGVAKGHGGSMHFFDASLGFYGGWAIVGGPPPPGRGPGAREQLPAQEPSDPLYLRGWGNQYRLLLRVPQRGQAVERPGRFPVRKQPLRHGDRAPSCLGDPRGIPEGGGLSFPRRAGNQAGCRRVARSHG